MKPDKREKIIRAAWEIFTTRRYHESTMDDVAEAAGVGKGTLYRYFSDKEALFAATISDAIDNLRDEISQIVSREEDPAASLLELVKRLVEFLEKKHDFFSIMHAEESRPGAADANRRRFRQQWSEKREELVAVVRKLLDRGTEKGVFRNLCDSRFAANIFIGMIRTTMRACEELPAGKKAEMAFDLLLHGIAATKGNK